MRLIRRSDRSGHPDDRSVIRAFRENHPRAETPILDDVACIRKSLQRIPRSKQAGHMAPRSPPQTGDSPDSVGLKPIEIKIKIELAFRSRNTLATMILEFGVALFTFHFAKSVVMDTTVCFTYPRARSRDLSDPSPPSLLPPPRPPPPRVMLAAECNRRCTRIRAERIFAWSSPGMRGMQKLRWGVSRGREREGEGVEEKQITAAKGSVRRPCDHMGVA